MINHLFEIAGIESEQTRQLYRLIRRYPLTDINFLRKLTGMTYATCSRSLDELVNADLVDDSHIGESNGGRKPKLYSINIQKKYLIGIELSNLWITVLLLDLALEIISTGKIRIDTPGNAQETLEHTGDLVLNLITDNKINLEDVLGVGVGVLTEGNEDKKFSDSTVGYILAEYSIQEIKEILTNRIRKEVMIYPATNLAALVEYRKKFWNISNNLLFVSDDMLVRSSIIINGQLLYETNEMIERFGHMIIDIYGQRCNCGSYGCLETLCSLPVIRKNISKKIKTGFSSSLVGLVEDINDISYFQLLQAIESGDELSVSVVKEAAYHFGIGLSNLICQFQTPVIIIGGVIGLANGFFEEVVKTVNMRLKPLKSLEYEIYKASESYSTVAQGAGCMILDSLTGETILNYK